MALSRWKIWRTYQLLKSSRNVAARHLGTDTAKCYPQPLLKPPFPEYESVDIPRHQDINTLMPQQDR